MFTFPPSQFLDRCTALLNLPFAARRLYDQDGKEHHNLDNLQRDQLAFVSCGEAWSDPNLSSQEQQRRMILATLAADVNAMKEFCALRNPMSKCTSDFVWLRFLTNLSEE